MTYWSGINPAIVGRRIAGVDVSEDKTRLTIRYVGGGRSEYEAEGDCCSESWIEHLTVPPDIEGATITGVGDGGYVEGRAATPEEVAAYPKDCYIDSLEVYQTAIRTDRGEVIVEYRNNSNGYYGGWLQERLDITPKGDQP